MTVQINGIRAARQGCDIRVVCQDPFCVSVEFHVYFAGFPIRIDRTGEYGTVVQNEIEMRNIINDHIAVDLLGRCRHRDLTAVTAGSAPAGRFRPQEDADSVIDDLCVIERDLCHGVIDEKDIAVCVGQRTAVHGEGRQAFRRVAGHGLVDHDCLVCIGFVTVLRIVVGSQSDIVQRHRVLSFHDDPLGGGGDHLGVTDSNIRCRIDDRGSFAVGHIETAVDFDSPAAPVGTDRRRGIAGRMDIQILRGHRAPARRHQSAGTVSARRDHRVGYVYFRSLSVAEYGIGVRAVGIDHRVADIQPCAVRRKDRAVCAVEVRFVAIGFTGLYDLYVIVGTLGSVFFDHMFSVRAVLQRFIDLDAVSLRD